MAFGTVVRPSGANGNTTFVLDTNNNVTATGGDGSVVASTTSSAKFTLSTVAAINYTASAVLSFLPAGNLINISATPATIASTPLAANGTTTLCSTPVRVTSDHRAADLHGHPGGHRQLPVT